MMNEMRIRSVKSVGTETRSEEKGFESSILHAALALFHRPAPAIYPSLNQ